MELDLTNYSISHSELSEDESLELALIQSFPQLDEDQENLVFGKLTHTIEIHEEEGSGMTRLIKTDDFLDDYFLEHFGVKGMHWGVRKDVSVKATPGKYVKTSGGTKQTASEDAIAAATYRQKAKKSTTDSLSNKELQSLVTRMNLEQQYSDLSAKSPRMNIAQKFLQKFKSNDKFRNKTIAQAKQVADSSPARKLERSLGEALKGM